MISLSQNKIMKSIFNSGWLIFDKIIRLFLGILVNIYLARKLGPGYYGEVSYAITYLAFFDAVNTLGLNQVILRDLSQSENSKNEILNITISLRLLSAAATIILSLFLAVMLKKDILLIAIVSSSLLFSIGNVCDLFFQSEIKSKYTVIAKIFAYIISSLFKIFIIWKGGTTAFYLIAVPLEFFIVSTLLFYLLYKKYNIKVRIRLNRKDHDDYWKGILKESLPLMISNIAITVFMRSGIMTIDYFYGKESLGVYSVGANLAEMIFFIPGIVVTSFSPILSNLAKNNREKYFMLYRRLMFMFWWGSLTTIILYGAFLFYMIPILYGHIFIESKYVFIIHLLSFLPVCMGCCQTIWVINEKKTGIILVQTIIGAVVAIVMNIYLVNRMGIIGAPIAILTAQLVQSFLVNYYFCKDLFVFTFRSLAWR